MVASSSFRRRCWLIGACALIGTLGVGRAQATTPGSLDPSFSADGHTSVDFGTTYAGAEALAIGPDGIILVVGGAEQQDEPGQQLAMARFTADDELDASFGGGDGWEVDPYVAQAEAVALQGDGKIVVVAPEFVGPGNVNWAIARFDQAGLPDASFGGDGIVTTDFGLEAAGPADVAVQPDGNIVVAGSTTVLGDTYRIVVARYTSDGNLDPDFGVDGMTIARIGHSSTASSLALAVNGEIVVAGRAQLRGHSDFCVARFRTDGTLDVRFDGDGKVTTDVGGSTDNASDVAIQQDGSIVVVGQAGAHRARSPDFAIVRYLPRGRLDPGFGGDGRVRTDFKGEEDWARGVAIQEDGKIVAGGYATKGGLPDFALARYGVGGRLDRSFGRSGLRRTDLGEGRDDFALDLVLQADGRIVAAGWVHESSGYKAGLARYLAA